MLHTELTDSVQYKLKCRWYAVHTKMQNGVYYVLKCQSMCIKAKKVLTVCDALKFMDQNLCALNL